nr:MAG TPA: hypothetical protein [Caudoviricetes sp.]
MFYRLSRIYLFRFKALLYSNRYRPWRLNYYRN